MSTQLSLTKDPISKLTWTIALPMSVGMFFNTMFNVVDTYYAGWLGTEALAALSLSFPLFFVLFSAGSGIGQGATALVANSIGEDRPQDARVFFVQSIVFVLAASVLLSVLGWFVSPWVFMQLGAEGSYLDSAVLYMRVIFVGGVFMLLPMVLNAALSAEGKTHFYRNVLVAGFVANLVLNPLFIRGWFGLPMWGVGGIALATVIVQLGGCVYLWRKAFASRLHQKPRWRDFQPKWQCLSQIAGQAIPAMLNMLTIAVGIFVITWFVKYFGQAAVAAYGIATRVEQIVLLPTIGLNAAVLSIVGQNYGAGLKERVQEAWRLNVKYGVVMMLGGGVLLALGGEPAMRLFSEDETVVQHGVDYLVAAACTLAAYPVLFVTVFALQGIKRPVFGVWLGISRQFLAPVLVLSLLVFVFDAGTMGVWWGICLVTWLAALVAFCYGKRKI